MRLLVLAAFALAAGSVGTEAQAHAHLLSASPAAGTVTAAPAALTLHFSEKLAPQFSGLTLSDAQGRAVALSPLAAPDPKGLAAAPKAPLRAGRYTVRWHAVSADTHRVQGSYGFTVK